MVLVHLDVFIHLVCTIAKDFLRAVRSSFVLGAESAGRERLDSKLSYELYLRRSWVSMEVERGVVWGLLLCQTIGIVVMDPLGEGWGDETVFAHLRVGRRDYPPCNSQPHLQKSLETNAHRRGRLRLRSSVERWRIL